MPSIHQEVLFSASPEQVFHALIDSGTHSAFTGAPAEISPEAGGAWSCYGGGITGRNIEIVENKRIVQAWRPGNWPEGLYSLVRFELQADGEGTRLVLDHTGFPADAKPHLEAGWNDRYWTPMHAYFKG